MCHLTYVVYSLTTLGMFFDSSPLAPLLEFLRCAFFTIYSSYNGIDLLTQSFSWSKDLFSDDPLTLELTIHIMLKSYFLVSTIVWGTVLIIIQIHRRVISHSHSELIGYDNIYKNKKKMAIKLD